MNNMLIKLSERNLWEHETWSYVLEVSNQNASALNHLMIFVKLANAEFEKAIPNATRMGGIPYLAMSRYNLEFYDSYIPSGNFKSPVLINQDHRLVLSSNNGYKDSGLMLDKKISTARMKSAMIAIRDRKENILYKNFEHIFLKPKNENKTSKKSTCKV